MPKEIKEKKVGELKDIKKQYRQKQAAEKNEGRYKKIKFVEKRKVIRKLEQIYKTIKEKRREEKKDKVDSKTDEKKPLHPNELLELSIEQLEEL